MDINLGTRNNDSYRWWDPIAGSALVVLVFLAANSIALTRWTADLNKISIIAVLGVISGIMIGQSRFKRAFSLLLAVLYGVGIFLWRFVFSLSNDYLWQTRLETVINRYRSVFEQMIANVPLDDGILFLTVMAIVFTILSLSIGYIYTRKGKPYTLLVILSLIFVSVQILIPYYRRRSLVFILFFTFLILFIGRMQFLQHKRKWETGDFQTDHDAAAYLFRLISVIAVLFSLTAWGVPLIAEKLSWVEKPTYLLSRNNVTNERLNNLLYPLRSLKAKFGDGMFSETIALGTSRSLDDTLVFTVNPPILDDFYGRFYWRARTYSTYVDGYWKNDGLEFSTVENIDLSKGLHYSEPVSDYQFTYLVNRKEVVTPQVVTSIDKNVEVAFYSVDEAMHDIIDFVDYQVVRAGQTITVSGGYYAFDIKKVTSSKPEYPAWIEERYLQVPAAISEQLTSLTENITAGRTTTFDKAVAVTHFLRNNYLYTDAVEIPEGQEPIRWFLYEGRKGFCNYFASSGVLMLRSIGIPSRFVVGYSQGESTGSVFSFEVSKKDSHSWIEVFFPDIGWIIFEATPSQPSLVYFETEFSDMEMTRRDSVYLEQMFAVEIEETNAFEGLEGDGEQEDSAAQEDAAGNQYWIFWVVAIPIVALVVVLYRRVFFVRKKPIALPVQMAARIRAQNRNIPGWIAQWAKYESLSLAEKQYQKIKNLSYRTKLIEQANLTPKEFFDQLCAELNNDEVPILTFSREYHQKLFSRNKDQDADILSSQYSAIIKAIAFEWYRRQINKLSAIFRRKPR